MQIAILLGTYNGATFLPDQLNSYQQQTHREWTLWSSDDGSSDKTTDLMNAFRLELGESRVHSISGPKKGFAANFLSLVCNPELQADTYAYSDQDDIWMEDKLERAAQFLYTIPKNIPALYCSRTLYVDQNNHPLGMSQAYSRPAIFQNALIQNIASGNTMVFNQAARKILMEIGPKVDIDLHDWWTYLLITGVGGKVFFDQTPSVRYRQHPDNLWGMNTSLKSQFIRIQKLFGGRFKDWNERHIEALSPKMHLLTPENQAIFHCFVRARNLTLIPRLQALRQSGVYRQTFMNNLGFFLAALMGKV